MTTLVGVLGYPVGHSRSPDMHNAAFRALGIDWRYEALEVEPERFEEVVRGLPQRGFAGANVTIPHKLRALELADRASDTARAVGAANTLCFGERGIEAHNTDAQGFVRALRERAPEAPAGMRALVLGAGGAARAVVYALIKEGASSVAVWNRHPERARALVEELREAGGAEVRWIPEPEPSEADLLVNATSVGMASGGQNGGGMQDFKELRLSADDLHDRQLMVDITYREGETALVHEARLRGLRCADGLDVLVHQGAASFELWTGMEPPLDAMRNGAGQRNPRST